MLIHVLAGTAHALTCAPGDAPCNDANTLRDRMNLLRPGSISDDHPRVRRRTSAVRDKLALIYDLAAAGGCTMDGLTAFTYGNHTWAGEWSRGAESGTNQGTYASGTIEGTYTGTVSGTVGHFGIYSEERKRLVAEWDAQDGAIGMFIPIAGRTGVGYAAIGTCPGEVEVVFLPYLPELAGVDDSNPTTGSTGAGFLRVSTLDAAAGGRTSSPSFRMSFALGGAQTPSESASHSVNPTLSVP